MPPSHDDHALAAAWFAGMSRVAQVDGDGMSGVAHMLIATGVGAEAYTPVQAAGHVMGVRQMTDAVVKSIQTAVSRLQGSFSCLGMSSYPS